MFLLPFRDPLPQEAIRREITVGERLLLVFSQARYEAVVANDGRVRLMSGERVPAVRRTLAELHVAVPALVEVSRVPARDAGFSILPSGTILRVADGTALVDALRGLPPVERVTILDRQDRAFVIERATFASYRLSAGDALVFGKEARALRASVIGGVARPGVYDISETTTLAYLVALAGGLTPRARTDRVLIERDRKSLGPFTLPRDAATPVRPSDVIRIPITESVTYVSVAGAVKRPGLIEVLPEMTVPQAIEAAGGLTLPASGLLVVLRSVTDPKRKPVRGRATDLTKFPTLKGGDILEIAPPPPPAGRPGRTQ